MKRIFFIVIFLLSWIYASQGQMAGILEDDARIIRGTMPNGLSYYLVSNSSIKGFADFTFIQKNGVAMEDSSTKGMTYLMECMALTETHNFPDGAIFTFMDDMGLNRTDGLVIKAEDYYTTYSFQNVPVSKNASVTDSMLLAMFNMSSALIVNDRSVERGKNFLKNTYCAGQTLERRIKDSLARFYYAGTPLAPAPEKELFRLVDRYTAGDVEAFYRTRCRPDMQAIVIAGDIDAAAVESKIRALFQVIPRPDTPLPEFPDSVLDAAGGGFFYFKDKEADRARITLDFIMPLPDRQLRNTAVPFVYDYLSGVGMDIMRRRLQDALEDAPLYAMSVDAETVPYLNRISYRLSLECAPEDCTDGYRLLINEVESLLKYGISEAEFNRSSDAFIYTLNDTYRRRSSLDNKYYRDLCVSNFTEGYVMAGIELYRSYVETAREIVDSTTVYDFLSSVFSDKSRMTVVCSSPVHTAGLEDIAADPQPYAGKAVPPIPPPPHPGGTFKDRNTFVNRNMGVVSRRLPNGATVACRKMKVDPGRVYFEAVARGGLSLSADSLNILREWVNDVAAISVNGGMNIFGLERLKESLHISLERRISIGSRRITGSFPADKADEFLSLAAMYFDGSSPDCRTFDKFRRMKSGCAPYALNSPESLFKALHTEDIRSWDKDTATGTALDSTGYMRTLRFINRLFSSASDFSFTFIGDFDEQELMKSVYSRLSPLPGGRYSGRRPASGGFYIASYDAVEEVTVPMTFPRRLHSVRLTVPSPQNIDERALSSITAKVIEREVIRRLSLRGIMAEASRRYHSYPEEVLTLDFQFTTFEDPGDLDAIFADIIVELAERGVTANEVDGVRRNMALKNSLMKARDYNYWKNILRNRYVDRKDYYTGWQAAVDAVTAADVNEALYGVLEDGRISVLSVIPDDGSLQ